MRFHSASWRSPCGCSTKAAWSWHGSCRRCAAPTPRRARKKKPKRAEGAAPVSQQKGSALGVCRSTRADPFCWETGAAPLPCWLGCRGSDCAPSRRNSAHKNSGHNKMTEPTTTIVSPDYSRSFFGHPRGLATLFMTEFFERFTYYGLRTMLVLFLAASTTAANPGFGVDGATAGAVYALFTGAAYLACIPGGWLADRLIGQRNAVFYGG